jgi:hypothetical protein
MTTYSTIICINFNNGGNINVYIDFLQNIYRELHVNDHHEYQKTPDI